ncbi:hypothetical protein LTR09_007404 [Extremus antarcticus]|uniref:Phospholipase/carboxylesterase/thioesterase domain-containing protein n=1 Tax=Extremus antarcticus TaxID=702011 RepID=A0AAJ0DCE2_9PEZI|nr:hypothetical protein LTR09_007404 [Extremus antarcticus]
METHNPTSTDSHTIIFLHGRGSTAEVFNSELFESQASTSRYLPQIFPHVKWVFPTADLIPSAHFSSAYSQWFEMHSTEDPHEREDEQDYEPAIWKLIAVIQQEAAIVGHQNVVLAGISQGAAIGLRALLRYGRKLGGFIGLCTWGARFADMERYSSALATPMFFGHNQDDQTIATKFGEEVHDNLKLWSTGWGTEVRWRAYPDGGHWIREPECISGYSLHEPKSLHANVGGAVDDLVGFLRENLRMGPYAADPRTNRFGTNVRYSARVMGLSPSARTPLPVATTLSPPIPTTFPSATDLFPPVTDTVPSTVTYFPTSNVRADPMVTSRDILARRDSRIQSQPPCICDPGRENYAPLRLPSDHVHGDRLIQRTQRSRRHQAIISSAICPVHPTSPAPALTRRPRRRRDGNAEVLYGTERQLAPVLAAVESRLRRERPRTTNPGGDFEIYYDPEGLMGDLQQDAEDLREWQEECAENVERLRDARMEARFGPPNRRVGQLR